MDPTTDPPANNSQTGAELQPPGDAAASPSAIPPSQSGLPASPKSDSAREPLDKLQRLSLTLNAAGLVISPWALPRSLSPSGPPRDK